AKSYDLSNVEFLGKISPDSIPNLYKKIDIIINYRRNEPVAHSVTPLKPLEAMAYKKLVITSDVLGMTEIVTDHETG
ncbi:glycosyltransferase, partial [Bacillus sp. SIMBA_154]|uniref:glycosyltransferase n=1 Tax=Bacillus sp. SIMBA_154 TaxID=3080859 RepID=UPI00397CDF15